MKLHRFILVALLGSVVVGCGDGGTQKPVDAGPDVGPPQPKCNDGIDNDGDGKIDYPNDPGCLVPQQDDETDDCPSGPNCPQCANGVDDDGNGQTDYPDDMGCSSAADADEITMNPIACGANVNILQLPITGMVTAMFDTAQTFAQISPCGGGSGGNIVVAAYELHLLEPKVIVASTQGSSVDTVLDIRSADCAADTSELMCNDNDASLSSGASKITYSAQAGLYYILVESKTNAAGTFKLTVQQLTGEGHECTDTSECGPGLLCRIPHGSTTMSCEKPVCNDGRDDDGDGKMDYPADPGCQTPDDADETDDCPSGPNCPACSNGSDDDGDAQTDYPNDTSCTAASGTSEACQGEEDPITVIAAGTTSGTLVGAHDDHDPTCGGNGGVDVLYTLTVPAMRSLTIDTEGTSTDTVLSLMQSVCTEPGIACDDNGGTSGQSSRLALSNVNPGTYVVAVDTASSSNTPGAFDLHVSGVISPGGSCNPADTLGGALACPVANPCVGTTGNLICQPSACGDGVDNDGDGITDFPMDPGCSSLDDTDETDTCASGPGPGCPECADGIDNDGDGQTDYPNDTSCTAPGQASEGCLSADGLTALTMPVTIDDTTGAINDTVHNECQADDSVAPDHTYSLQVPPLKSLSINGDSDFDGVLVLLDSTCGGTALACEDGEQITRQNVAAGTYFLVVDGYFDDSVGTTTLTVSGVIQNGASCEAPLAQSGALICGPGFACTGTPGSRTCRPAPCGDGLDNDGDGIADYPNDPGCSSASDMDETDSCPSGADCPACSNGQDDDGDGSIDYPDDPSCGAASGTSEVCAVSEQVVPIVMPSTPGTTVGTSNDMIPECASSFEPTTAGDNMYSITIPPLSSLTLEADAPSFDAAISLFDATCGGAALDCEEFPSTIEMGSMAAGTYYVSVDGYSDGTGAYTLNVSGTIENGASCENPLADVGALTCGVGFTCKGPMGARTCERALCSDGIDNDGDGITDFPLEPGCASIADDDETDPTTPAACSNAMDDDGDSTMDFPGDVGCAGAGADTEVFCAAETDPLTMITMPTMAVDLTSTSHSVAFECQSSTGHDQVLGLSLPVNVTSLTIDTEGSTVGDTVVELLDPQCTASVGCDDDGGTSFLSQLALTDVPMGNYGVAVAGYGTSGSNDGPVTLNVHGTVASGTRCDSALFTAGVLACDAGLTCTGTPATCQ